ncbi:hypothetical protein OH686_01225 [Pseudomonas sp. SO81]|nr:hypothetical protein OH686_01225 [Pseudomonas sp. SO81]
MIGECAHGILLGGKSSIEKVPRSGVQAAGRAVPITRTSGVPAGSPFTSAPAVNRP